MGTDSVDEVIDDTSVLFADPNASNKERSSVNGATNAGAALTHKMEKKLRTSKTPSKARTPTSKTGFVHKEMENDRTETSDTSKIALLPPNRLLVPAKTASDQPLIAYDLDSDEEVHFSRAPKSKFPSNKEATARLLANDFDIELRSDEDDGDALDLIRPQSVQPSCVCCKLTTCNIQ